MGYGNMSSNDWTTFSSVHLASSRSTTGTRGVFSSTEAPKEFLPKNITYREARDNADHPNSTPIIICPDVTGSMSPVLRSLIDGLGTLVTEIYERKPVSDPQICFMAVGDAACDVYPLQVTQFESDIRIAESLKKIYLEQHGGGNDVESYTLPWYFAANYVKADAIEKRHKKGIIFTMGDECLPSKLTVHQLKRVFNEAPEEDIATEELLNLVSRDWEVFHLVIEEGNFYSSRYREHNGPAKINNTWGAMLGERVLHVSDHTKIAEIIVSTLQVLSGDNVDSVASSWDGSTSVVVRNAIGGLTNLNEEDNLVTF